MRKFKFEFEFELKSNHRYCQSAAEGDKFCIVTHGWIQRQNRTSGTTARNESCAHRARIANETRLDLSLYSSRNIRQPRPTSARMKECPHGDFENRQAATKKSCKPTSTLICRLFTTKVEIQYNTNKRTGQTDYKLHNDLKVV